MPVGTVLKAIQTSGSASPEVFKFGQALGPGIWQFSAVLQTGSSSSYIYQASGKFPVYGNFTFAGYSVPVSGKIPVFNTGVANTGYSRYVQFDPQIVLFAPSVSSPSLTLYPNSVLLPNDTDYVLGVLIREF